MKDQIFNAFNQIHAEEALIEKTLEGMYSYREKRSRRAFFPKSGMALALSFVMMLCIGVTGWQTYFTQAFALSVDVNPSIELTVNRFDRVISAKGLNAEGRQVVASVDVRHMNYADAVDCLLEEEKASGYLEDEGTVLVAVACPKEEKSAKVKETIDTTQADKPQTVAVVQPEAAVVEEAQKHDMSFGKYQAYLDIHEVAPAVTTEEVKVMSVQDIATIMQGDTTTQTGIAMNATTNVAPPADKTPASGSGDVTTVTTPTPNNGTQATTSATPNGGTQAHTGATPNGNTDKKPVTTPNSNSNSNSNSVTNNDNVDKKPVAEIDKKPADGGEVSNNSSTGETTNNASDGSVDVPTDENIIEEEPVTEIPSDENEILAP